MNPWFYYYNKSKIYTLWRYIFFPCNQSKYPCFCLLLKAILPLNNSFPYASFSFNFIQAVFQHILRFFILPDYSTNNRRLAGWILIRRHCNTKICLINNPYHKIASQSQSITNYYYHSFQLFLSSSRSPNFNQYDTLNVVIPIKFKGLTHFLCIFFTKIFNFLHTSILFETFFYLEECHYRYIHSLEAYSELDLI